MKKRSALILLICASSSWAGQTEPLQARVAELQRKALAAVMDPARIPAVSNQILEVLSSPSSLKQLSEANVELLTRMQTKLANYYRVNRVLSSANCNVDPTTSNPMAAKILKSALEQPVCHSYSMDLLSGFKNFDTLADVLQMMDDDSYTGIYTLGKEVGKEESNEKRESHGLTLDNGRGAFVGPGTQVAEGVALHALASAPRNEGELASSFRGELFRQGLRSNFKTYLELHARYAPSASAESLAKGYCHPTGQTAGCSAQLESLLLKDAREKLKTAQPVPSTAIASEINRSIDQMNQILQKLSKNALPSQDIRVVIPARNQGEAQQTFTLPGKPTGSGMPTDFSDIGQAQKDYAEYQRIYSEMILKMDPMQRLLLQSKLDGPLAPRRFSMGTIHLPYPRLNASDFSAAVEDHRKRVRYTGASYLSLFDSKESTENQIKEMIRMKPYMTSGLLMKDPGYASLACKALKELSVDEMNANQKRDSVKAAAILISGMAALGGLPAPTLVASAARVGQSLQDKMDADEEMGHALSELDQERAAHASEKRSEASMSLVIGTAMVAVDGVGLAKYAGAVASAAKAGKTFEEELEVLANAASSGRMDADSLVSLLNKHDSSEILRAVEALKGKLPAGAYARFYGTALKNAPDAESFTRLAQAGLRGDMEPGTQMLMTRKIQDTLVHFLEKNPTRQEFDRLFEVFPTSREVAVRTDLSAQTLMRKHDLFEWGLSRAVTRDQYYLLAKKYMQDFPSQGEAILRSYSHLVELEKGVTDPKLVYEFAKKRVDLLDLKLNDLGNGSGASRVPAKLPMPLTPEEKQAIIDRVKAIRSQPPSK